MKLFTECEGECEDYEKTIDMARKLTGAYDDHVVFHCYWTGQLNDKHLFSIKSCYYFNVCNRVNKKIVLWVENNVPNEYNTCIAAYAEIRQFDLEKECTFSNPSKLRFNKHAPSYYSDLVRYSLLYKYGGCWFDLDVLFLRCFEPLFRAFGNTVMVYRWAYENYPNGAIYISLEPYNPDMKANIDYIMAHGAGWGFQEARLTLDLPLRMLVLPCSWFDGVWIRNPHFKQEQFNVLFESTCENVDFADFLPGAFAFHWHNQWNTPLGTHCVMRQLTRIMDTYMSQSSLSD